MTWYPIAFLPPQYVDSSGTPYSGAVLKMYADGTTTPINMATDYTGATLADSFALNSAGYPISEGGSVIIPHVQENYKVALYPTQAAADADSGALWEVDDNQIADPTSTALLETFSGDGSTVEFTLSTDLGTDEKTIMVFADRLREYSTNGTFASDTGWTKGTGWTIASGVATATGAISTDIEQDAGIQLIEGESYTVTFTVSNFAAGTITPEIGGTAGTARSADGTYTETIIAGSTQKIAFSGSGYTGDIDNVSVHRVNSTHREILRDDEFTLDGTTLTLDEAPPSGTNNILVFSPSSLLGAAGGSAAAAAISEANAAASAAKLQGTSTTSVAIGTGSKGFTTQEDKFFTAGTWLLITSDADPTNYMHGQVTAYSTTSLTVNVTNVGGSGTFADWTIQVAGTRGAQGATGTVSGASAVAAAAADRILLLDNDDSDALIEDDIESVVSTIYANQAEAEAGTATNKVMTPERVAQAISALLPTQQLAVAWGVFDGTNTGTFAALAGYNIGSITRNATGDYSIPFTNDMASANYVVATASSRDNDGTDLGRCLCEPSNLAAGSFDLNTGVFSTGFVAEDHSRVHFVVYGTLA